LEQLRFAPPSLSARDKLGSAVALAGDQALVGAPGDDGLGANSGAVWALDAGLQRVFFESAEYVALEGNTPSVVVTVGRDPAPYTGFLDRALTVGYATSDLTARGVDTLRFAQCMDLPLQAREGCGDYLQTAGEVTFAPGDATVSFVVYVVNDLCHEHYPEYFLVTLSVPGGPALAGEDYVARVRIDDDDLDRPDCKHDFL